MSPAELDDDPMWTLVRESTSDAGTALDEFAATVDAEPTRYRWSFSRDFGGVRLLMVDSRCARVLEPGARAMLDAQERDWLDTTLRGDADHVLVASSIPVLLPIGLHYVEAWNEAVADGAWGKRWARVGERIRQALDLEHWAAFRTSFVDLSRMVMELARGERGAAPVTVQFLSGDVHYSYLSQAKIPDASGAVYQLVCSPIRNPLSMLFRYLNVVAAWRLLNPIGRVLARMAGVKKVPFRWRNRKGPWFDNCLATVDFDGRHATARWHTASGADESARELVAVTLS